MEKLFHSRRAHLAASIVLLAGCLAGTVAVTARAADAPAAAVTPFNGRDMTGWNITTHKKNTTHWIVGAARLHPDDPRQLLVDDQERAAGQLINAAANGVDIFSNYEYGDAVIELEVMVPQGSNSGIYVHGEYEVQVLDSFGTKKPGPGDMGAVYGAAPPSDPLYRKPGEWQQFQIVFRAPRFDALGKKTANARLERVTLNGRVIHQNIDMKGPTPGGVSGKEAARGPLMFQGDHGPVAFRNITIRPLN